jgi:hypothetical protein
MDINQIQTLLLDFEHRMRKMVQEFNDETGTVIEVNFSYMEVQQIGTLKPTCLPVIRASSRIM